MNIYILFIPWIILFFLPVIVFIYKAAKAGRIECEKEMKRQADMRMKQLKEAARQAAKEHDAQIKKAAAAAPAGSVPKRGPGRPRKNPEQRPEIISKPAAPAALEPLQVTCTPEQFAAWII